MSQLTSNTAQPVVINSIPTNVDTTTPTLQADNNGQPILKVANTCFNSIVGTPEKATINTSNSNYDGHLDNFPSRKEVTIVVPAKLRNEKHSPIRSLLTDRLSNTLSIHTMIQQS